MSSNARLTDQPLSLLSRHALEGSGREVRFTPTERATLAWTEAVTRVSESRVTDDVFKSVRQHFSEKELANLTLAVATTNAWNRLAISARTVPGAYVVLHARVKKSA